MVNKMLIRFETEHLSWDSAMNAYEIIAEIAASSDFPKRGPSRNL
jgi:hypothetical protein